MTNTCPINHAKSYPFDIPEHSYVLRKEGWTTLDVGPNECKNRHAVIASGSNASPDRLMRKFAGHPQLLENPLYITRATLHEFDAVYSAHISHYGSIPATLAHAPGTQTDVFVTWLTDHQLERMHETEAVGVNYDYARLQGIGLVLENGSGYTQAHAYMSKRGCLNHDGHPIALSSMKATGRIWKAMNQAEVLNHARSLIAPGLDTDSFIKSHIDCPDTRQARTDQLAATALDHGWSGGFNVLK